MDDLTLNYLKVKDQAIPQPDGTVLRVKRYAFFLGKHGPFTEDIPVDKDQQTELRTRVTAQRQLIQAIGIL